MGRGAHRVEDIARVDHQVHIPLQDGIHGPPVSLLDVHLSLIAARLLMELRVPAVSQVRVRDVGYTYYIVALLSVAIRRLYTTYRLHGIARIPAAYR
jgi:hypothetical protein